MSNVGNQESKSSQQKHIKREHLSDTELHELLQRVDLDYLISTLPSQSYHYDYSSSSLTMRTDNVIEERNESKNAFKQNVISQNWIEILSPGEQQRLCIARLLFQKPDIAVLDEATRSLFYSLIFFTSIILCMSSVRLSNHRT
jgi:ABC-type uncharacterized transport system fused permease/ATPase subunit